MDHRSCTLHLPHRSLLAAPQAEDCRKRTREGGSNEVGEKRERERGKEGGREGGRDQGRGEEEEREERKWRIDQ